LDHGLFNGVHQLQTLASNGMTVLLPTWIRVLQESHQLFMEPKLPCSQEPITGPCP